jgi:hypothetical protein
VRLVAWPLWLAGLMPLRLLPFALPWRLLRKVVLVVAAAVVVTPVRKLAPESEADVRATKQTNTQTNKQTNTHNLRCLLRRHPAALLAGMRCALPSNITPTETLGKKKEKKKKKKKQRYCERFLRLGSGLGCCGAGSAGTAREGGGGV